MRLQNQVVLLTGASQGIGRALAWGLAREGARLALVARTTAPLEALANELQQTGCQALPLAADVSSPEAVDEMVRRALAHYQRVDVLINCAGIQGVAGRAWEVEPADWWRTVEVNLGSVFLCCRAILPSMIARQRGRIINVSSGAGQSPMPHYSAYAASKAAVTHFTRVLAEETKPYGINVNAVGVWGVSRLWQEVAAAGNAGGPSSRHVEQMLQQGRHPLPEENVPLVIFLASEAAQHISGQYIEANSLPTFVTQA